MSRSTRGISLIEVLVVLLSLTLVGSMAFQLLWENNTAVTRNLSQSSKADRLRLLQKALDRDLSSLYPNPLEAGLSIGDSTDESGSRELLRSHLIESDLGTSLAVYEVIYSLREFPEGSGRTALVRTLDPDLDPGLGEEADSRAVFTLDVEEVMDWEVDVTDWRGVTSPARIRFTLTDKRFKDFPTKREILVHGAEWK